MISPPKVSPRPRKLTPSRVEQRNLPEKVYSAPIDEEPGDALGIHTEKLREVVSAPVFYNHLKEAIERGPRGILGNQDFWKAAEFCQEHGYGKPKNGASLDLSNLPEDKLIQILVRIGG